MENWHYEIHQMYHNNYKVISPWEDMIFIDFDWDSVGELNDRDLSTYKKFLKFLNETQLQKEFKLAKVTLDYI